MNLQNVQEKGKNAVEKVTHAIEEKGKDLKDKITATTQGKVSELTEEAITTAVDQAIDVIQLASQRVRERTIPTENVALEVSLGISGLVKLTMKADVPKSGEIKNMRLDEVEKIQENLTKMDEPNAS
ncbi:MULTISPECIES: hypothetical protein [unclassified Coleofasciculus]|uniref:hypothetical protein n=1 Tax=unclassified Coleofasciculus TaxID=2692782 RepID=UPI0018826AEB|nr:MULTISPECIES: hypothetical protein [unclassified Coleofasciculus]MBE9126650.1 hypothetical protein [Coleofasciculus sp. LEGE 07081]MBE9148492.1 hypothetical protein [Coleofasciculus sp. LEGE 07092]